jgi:hypothetical protein
MDLLSRFRFPTSALNSVFSVCSVVDKGMGFGEGLPFPIAADFGEIVRTWQSQIFQVFGDSLGIGASGLSFCLSICLALYAP